MKRIISLLLLFVLLGTAGCGNSGEGETDRADESRSEEQTIEKTTEETIEETTETTIEETEEETKLQEDETMAADVPSVCGALQVEGTALTDQDGRPVRLRGISTHGLSWFPKYVNEDCFRQLRTEWNVNVVRLAMYTAESGGYCTDGSKEDLKEIIRRGVEYAVNQDMYVIIDWHILSDGNPNQHLEEARDFFREMSETYRDCDNVLYEICNEPNGNTSWGDIKAYAEEIIGVIRENDPDGVILVGTPNWSQMVDQAAEDPITGYENIMYTLHFYAATHTDWLRETMKKAIDDGLPVFVSEYGICDASGNGNIDEEQADTWVQAMEEYGVSYVAWNLSNKAETSAILKESCSKYSGFDAEDLSKSGKWLYETLTGKRTEETSGAKNTEPDKTADSGPMSGGTADIAWRADLKNSWESDGKVFCQYVLTISNLSERELDGWEVSLGFTEEIALSDGWNGTYKAEGNTLYISSADYNGRILAGGEISDVGFIVSGTNAPALTAR